MDEKNQKTIQNITPREALDYITNVIRSKEFTYDEHVHFENCRNVILPLLRDE